MFSGFPDDDKLRAYGYVLKHRPDHGEAVWEHVESKVQHTQSEALRLMASKDAVYEECAKEGRESRRKKRMRRDAIVYLDTLFLLAGVFFAMMLNAYFWRRSP